MTWKKRIISIVLCLCALLCAASVRAEATGAHSHPICGANHKDIGNHTSDNCSTPTWTAWNGTQEINNSSNLFKNTSKLYLYLSEDVTTNNNIIVPENKTLYLCLNGYSLANIGQYESYTIQVDGTLVLCDCNSSKQNNGNITHGMRANGTKNTGAGVAVYDGTFIMYGGKISNNASRGVDVNGGTFTMYGGEISGNTYADNPNYNYGGGAGVRVRDSDTVQGNFAMYGGKISNNTYKGGGDGGGVYASGTGDFIIQGGKITDNQCSYNGTNTSVTTFGGGLYITDRHSTLKIENNTVISNNTCDGDGGGIFIGGDATGSITNCTISGNNATRKDSMGGGLTFQNSTFTIEKCTITDNKTAGKGGAICLMTDDAYVTLSSGLNFSGNAQGCTADENGKLNGGTANDVYLNSSSAYLRLTSDFSKTSADPIVVTTYFEPNSRSTVKIAEGSASAAKATDFTYGNDSAISIIAKTNNGTVELLACKHDYSPQKDETNHWQECSICGDKKDVAKHTYSTDWQTNSTKHWHECECGQRSGEAKHSYSSDWKTGDGKHWHECECGQKSEEAEHSYSTAWDRDNTSHFHKCSACGDKTDIAICVYDKEDASSNYRVSNATCTAKAVYRKSCVCARAGTETFESGEKNPNNHTGTLGDWQTNTDEHWKVYSCCQTKVQEGKHTWDKGKVTTPATCTTPGERTYTCTACSATKKETIPATGHAWDTEWSKDNDHHWHECNNANCDAVKDKAEHDWDDGEVTTPATCTADGVKTLTCTVCSATKKETIPATGHAWDTEWSKDNDHHWHKCKNANCDAVKDKAEHDWNDGEVTTPATCTTVGEKTYTCTACSATKTEVIPATGHAWDTEWSKDNDHHWHKCKNANCDAVKDKAEHSWNEGEVTTPPTCTAAGVKTYTCAVCSATKTEPVPATGHTYNQTKVEDKYLVSAATCTAKAVYYKSCVCGATGTATFEHGEKNPNNHTGQLGDWQTNTDEHWKVYSCCQAQIDKAAHAWNEGEVTTPATCTTAGEKTYTCAVCSAKKTEEIQVTGHAWDTEWSKDNDHHWHKCKNCDAITDLTAHVPGAAATETTPQLCTKCGYVIAPATHPDHTWVFVAETPATCNAAGEREHYKCTCGRTSFKNGDVYDINKDASVLTIEKNSANHTGAPDSKWHSDSANHWQEYTCCHARANEAAHSGGAATCTAQAVCEVCGKAYGPLAAHDWGAWKVTTPATKDAPGVETRTCAHNSAHTETRSIPKLSTAVYTVSEDTKIAQIEAKVDGLDKILELNENKALVNDGKSVGVSLTVKNTASSGVSEKIKEKLAGSNLVGLRLELTVEKTVTANGVVESKQTIPDAGVLLKTTITLPTELQGKSGYVVYRLHDGNVHVLTETANENGEFISVSADKTQITICARLYSEYVIAYQTGGGYHPVNPTPVKATSANTGDAGVLLYGVTAALSLTGTAWLGAKSRKH